MPAFIAMLLGGLIEVVGTIVGKVLLSLGIGYATFTGIDASMTWAKNQFLSGIAGLPADAVSMAATLKLGVCVSMLLSALTIRLTLMGLASGTVKRMISK